MDTLFSDTFLHAFVIRFPNKLHYINFTFEIKYMTIWRFMKRQLIFTVLNWNNTDVLKNIRNEFEIETMPKYTI